jgi:hypothetical protein
VQNLSRSSDFDFFLGSWRVRHRQRKQRLAGNNDWIEFGGTTVAGLILGGAGNVDDNLLDHPAGAYRAATLRAFDAPSGTWSIWWLDGRIPGRLDTPMVGRFDQGIGTFLADDVFEGRPIRVRFLWDATVAGKPRWEQAFSIDRGESWETNWIMEFSPNPGGE